jgi:hypothetical protein
MTHLLPSSSLSSLNKRVSLSALISSFEADAKLENPDSDVPLSALTMSEGDNIQVPDLGTFTMTEWSLGQLARLVGVHWPRWIVGSEPAQRAEELNRRLARAKDVIRVRSTKKLPEGASVDGVITAIVSPSYSPAPDHLIGSLLADALKDIEPDAEIIRASTTDKTTSFVVKIGEKFEPAKGTPVGALNGGLLVQNSGVGFCALTLSVMLQRLSCKNGMTVSAPGSMILSHRHRGLDLNKIRAALNTGLDGVGERLYRGAQAVVDTVGVEVDNVEAEVDRLLRGAKMPLRLLPSIMEAYGREPHASRFGVSQAITLAAQQTTAEIRHDLERLAGEYVAGAR